MSDGRDDELRAAKDLLIAEEIIAAMRHDLRNKLAAIRQAAYYIKTKTQPTELWGADPRIARFFGLIDEQVDAADAIFGSSPVLAKLHRRVVAPIAARAIIERAVRAAGASEAIAVGAVEDVDVPVDQADLILALEELIDNALDATAAAGSPPEERPTIGGACRGEHYVFTVSNPGPPIDAKSFRGFVRGFESSREDRRGIGLSIARHVAVRYGGSLALREGEPSTTIDLAVARSLTGA